MMDSLIGHKQFLSVARSQQEFHRLFYNAQLMRIQAAVHLVSMTGYEYAVLVTNTAHEVLSLGQLYRKRQFRHHYQKSKGAQ